MMNDSVIREKLQRLPKYAQHYMSKSKPVHVNAWIDEDTSHDLQRAAFKDGLSVSHFIRRAIKAWLDGNAGYNRRPKKGVSA